MAGKILVVEDDPTYQAILEETLTAGGYEVVRASSGETALAKLKETRPDLIVLDITMESAISGFEVAYRVKSRDPISDYAEFVHTPILILTAARASSSFPSRPEEEYIPVEALVEKPVIPAELLRQVETLMRLRD